MLACGVGNALLASKLIENGANIEARDTSGDTPIMTLLKGKKERMIDITLDHIKIL